MIFGISVPYERYSSNSLGRALGRCRPSAARSRSAAAARRIAEYTCSGSEGRRRRGRNERGNGPQKAKSVRSLQRNVFFFLHPHSSHISSSASPCAAPLTQMRSACGLCITAVPPPRQPARRWAERGENLEERRAGGREAELQLDEWCPFSPLQSTLAIALALARPHFPALSRGGGGRPARGRRDAEAVW